MAFLEDPAKRKCGLTSRRAGKTTADVAGMLDALIEHPEDVALYTTLTSSTSASMLWPALMQANKDYGLRLTPKLSELRLYHPRGGYIWLSGLSDIREAEKYRGYKYSRVIIDEAGTYRSAVLTYAIDAVFDDALSDLNGDLWLTGTPGPIPQGYFWARSTGDDPELPGWKTHHWTVLDNPHHRYGAEDGALEAHRAELGVGTDDPTWIREKLGLWCLDESSIIYYFDPQINSWDGVLPEGKQRTILSIDLGYDDETAFVVTTSVRGFSTVFGREAFGKSQLLPSHIAQEIFRLRQRYQINEIYVDSGGLGKTILRQLQEDYGLPAIAAEKQDKAGSIYRVQAALKAGNIKLDPVKCAPLIDEWNVLPWDKDRKTHCEGFADHNADAWLYGHRQHPHTDTWEHEPPEPGSPEAAAAWAADMRSKKTQKKKLSY